MPNRTAILPEDLVLRAIDCWMSSGFLLTAGDYASNRFNTMTVGWGSFGVMWGKPIAAIVVRPSRYTFEFIEEFDSFTLCLLPEGRRDALQICGTVSGRDENKIKRADLTPMSSSKVAAPGFAEAELIVECRKLYADSLRLERLLDREPTRYYPEGDMHVMYLAEIVAAQGTTDYLTTAAGRRR